MSDERIIYIGPEDDLTSVRERLEQVPSRQVTLVLPPTTQLRGHVAWQLLYKRARELGKEVLIVSSDPQIRSVAHAGKFRVATSLEASSAPGKSRPPSRPTRTNPSRVRYPSSPRSVPKREASGPGGVRSRQFPDVPASQQPAASRDIGIRHPFPNGPRMEEAEFPPSESEQYKSPAYDFRIDTTPPIHPLSPQQFEEEEPDLLSEDYRMSRGIREAASRNKPAPQQQESAQPPQKPRRPSKTLTGSEQKSDRPSGKLTRPRRISVPLAPEKEDPFASVDDNQPAPSHPEQRGGISFNQFGEPDSEVHQVPEESRDLVDGELEFRDDDTGAFIPISDSNAPSLEDIPLDEEELPGPSARYEVRPHGSQPAGGMLSHLTDQAEDDLPPVEEQPGRTAPRDMLQSPSSPRSPAPPRRSTPLQQQQGTSRRSVPLQPSPSQGAGRRSTPLQPSPSPSQGAGRRSTPLQQQSSRRPMAPSGSAPGTRYPSRSSRAPASRRPALAARSQRSSLLPWLIVATVILALGLLAYLLPTASVTLTLQARSYTHALTLVARQSNGQTGATPSGIIPAQTQTRTFAMKGTAVATGTKQVGTQAATGYVTFTNNGNQAIHVPTGTIISTAGGVQFSTTADSLVNIPGSPGNTVLVPVQAVEQGDIGNVAAGTITVIPPDSVNAIAKDKDNSNIAASSVLLQVTNSQPTGGGGVGSANVIQQQDIDAARGNLHDQAQPAIDAWLKQLAGQGLVGSSSETDQWVNPPQSGQVVQNVNVPVTLNVKVSVLMARNSDVQRVVASQLNAFLQQQHDPNYQNMVVFVDARHPANIQPTAKPSGDASSITLPANVTALALPNITQQQVRNDSTGKSLDAAQQYLSLLPGVQHVNISLSPAFFPWMPLQVGNINVILQPGT